MCAVISGDSIISVTGTGSGLAPYSVSANFCAGIAGITNSGRDVLPTDKVVALTAPNTCRLVTIPEVCGVPNGGATNQLLMKASGTDCDIEWRTPPYVRVSRADTAFTVLESTLYSPDFDTAVSDPFSMWDVMNASVVTIPWDGWWTFGAQIVYTLDPLDTYDGYVTLKVGRPATLRLLPSSTIVTGVNTYMSSGSAGDYLSVGDYLEIEIGWTPITTPTASQIEASEISMWAIWHSP